MLTGSQPDGTTYTDGKDHTCNNWTSSANGNPAKHNWVTPTRRGAGYELLELRSP